MDYIQVQKEKKCLTILITLLIIIAETHLSVSLQMSNEILSNIMYTIPMLTY